ncbi:GT4 family glycosyltransferase PelF [Atopomonas sediminilitoris]|uniref:GT4 family glycosyltransferase PelF n=1 Tax=Atopomonas sediminilitoris TaxID=2919919 RepID=UPI001F4E58BB|nr:GT4 family glycosyltransferase PelF [Atopomonas sediminilitoris]MCJ8168925.1 GT4 family glycosyltransferase PelF [Atopomonas sediminilitoris]
MLIKPLNDEPVADVCLLLEGTYPYVRGGVSSWVHQIINGLPEVTFAVIFLGGSPRFYEKQQYQMPTNVVHFECHFLETSWEQGEAQARPGNRKAMEKVRELHTHFHTPDKQIPDELAGEVMRMLGEGDGLSRDDFLYSRASWDAITDGYEKYCTDPSFVNYFWTLRSMHAPVFLLAEVARNAPPCRLIHSVSTGYAGMLGAFLQRRWHRPFFVSEHGIYTKERKIDLAQASWIADNPDETGEGLNADVGYIRRMWISFFEQLGRLTYNAADPIVSLYGGNRERQISDGALEQRCRVIPNGISLNAYADALGKRPEGIPKVVGLIGRVVPIKDIKTFIRAMRGVITTMPEAEGWIVGPDEEDPAYAAECRSLVASLGLVDKVKFLGFQKIPEIMPQLGVMVLTSISEAQPLVILEAYAAGVPCVATDVGSCRELIEGGPEDDRKLGSAGEAVAIADPQASARAILALLGDQERWKQAQAAGLARVTTFYTEELMFQRYRDLYQQAKEA